MDQASEFTPQKDGVTPKSPNALGTYVDPESKAVLVANSRPQADAFVRMGWKRQDREMEKAVGRSERDDAETLLALQRRAHELGIGAPGNNIQSLRMRIGKAEKALTEEK